MRLPNAGAAIIPHEKLRDYLLSSAHPTGRFKAAFFRRLGYTEDTWRRLETDLRLQHLVSDAEEIQSTSFGRKFAIRGFLVGPSGDRAVVVSVWIIRRGEDVPRFVTAYPGGER